MLGLGIAGFALVALGYLRTGKVIFWRTLATAVALVNAIHIGRDWDQLLFQSLVIMAVFTLTWHKGPLVLLLFLVLLVLIPNVPRCRCQSPLTSCKSNLKNTAVALEMYSVDNLGFYPHKLGQLTPNYLKIIPNCPSTQRNDYVYGTNGREFTLYCFGDHTRSDTAASFPRYSSHWGLIER